MTVKTEWNCFCVELHKIYSLNDVVKWFVSYEWEHSITSLLLENICICIAGSLFRFIRSRFSRTRLSGGWCGLFIRFSFASAVNLVKASIASCWNQVDTVVEYNWRALNDWSQIWFNCYRQIRGIKNEIVCVLNEESRKKKIKKIIQVKKIESTYNLNAIWDRCSPSNGCLSIQASV